MLNSHTRTRRARVGLVPVMALAACALLPATAGNASSAPDAGAQPASSSPERDMKTSYVPDGKLELTKAQKSRLDAAAARTLRNSKPGGVRIAPDTIVWEDEGVIMNLPVNGKVRDYDANSALAADGKVRLYKHANFSGRRLTFVKCKFQKLRWYDFTNETSSWKNSQYGGAESWLYYWNGSKVKYLDSLYPGESSNWRFSGSPLNDRADFLRVCK